jgi:predicted acylesterase/phospholipase RssA
VLSGGAALGFAHVGFLKVLEEAGVPVDAVIGNSMGSLIGALYAAGYSPGDIETVASQINWAQIFMNEGVDRTASLLEGREPFFRLAFDSTGTGESRGLVPDQNITLLISRLLYRVSMIQEFSALPKPFRAIAVDIVKGRGVPLDRGALYRAVRSSISIPVAFPPVPLEGTFMVDGGILDNNPVDLALDWGADVVIDVDVGSFTPKNNEDLDGTGTVADLTLRFVQSRSSAQGDFPAHKEYRLVMDLRDFAITDFAKSRQLIDRGEEIARMPEHIAELEDLAKWIEKTRPLEKRDWNRRGTYSALPEPVFSRVRLESISASGREESAQVVEKEFPPPYLALLFNKLVDRPVDFSRLEAAIEIIRRRGNYENVGYRLESEGETYTLALTGVRAITRKHSISLAVNAGYMQNERAYLGLTSHVDLALQDVFLPDSLVGIKFTYNFTDVQGPGISVGYTKKISRWFYAEAQADAAYYTTPIQSFNRENELSSLGIVNTWARFIWKPADFFSASLAYRYSPLWYENEPSVFASGGEPSSYYGDLHSAVLKISYDTINITQPLFFTFLYNVDWNILLEYPFAGSRLYSLPWYERLEIFGRKAWVPRPNTNFLFDLSFASYLGELESRWSLFSPVGPAGIPGYSAMDDVLSRNKFTAGITYLEEIVPLSNLLNMRSFFAVTLRGGSFWAQLESAEQFGSSWIGGVRTGLQIETPIGMLSVGPELSLDGRVMFCVYFN